MPAELNISPALVVIRSIRMALRNVEDSESLPVRVLVENDPYSGTANKYGN